MHKDNCANLRHQNQFIFPGYFYVTFWQVLFRPAVRGKYVYVFGRATDLSNYIYDDVAVYDTKADAWMTLDNRMTRERKSTGAVVSGDTLYVFGGIACDPPGVWPGDGGNKTGSHLIETGTLIILKIF